MSTLELRLLELRVNIGGEPPLIVLQEVGGDRRLPIWTDFDGMTSVVAATEAAKAEAVCAQALIVDLLVAFEHKLEAVSIVDYEDGRFFAEITVDKHTFNLRPTDAIALSILAGCRITCTEKVLAAAGVFSEAGQEVERFREFLDSVKPVDFSSDGLSGES
ncbi:MAG: bifunctional nuclease family protein [Propionibacteriaceae bacterium]|jgi:bifunctional DNase/RNase|nr:bifunctional nuclease family protein [Propionibacteriaceae bacterium]